MDARITCGRHPSASDDLVRRPRLCPTATEIPSACRRVRVVALDVPDALTDVTVAGATQRAARHSVGDGGETMSFVAIRRGHPEDAVAIADVWLRARAASVPAIPPPAHTEDDVREWLEEVVLAARDVWVAEEGDALVAVLILEGQWIDQLYVDPGSVGRGHGADLIAVAKQARPSGLKLWTFEANVRARRFYERHGFVPTGATSGDNEEGAPDVRYEWRPPKIGAVP